ncbi:bifunctional adenosylcobinamide kinase/adenosylcobinamide-phosphate guanylyltransferase [Desulfatirhabdium butyrativorans]|uniref:bifunctional adenosylcobinamide kinase/adenosylcobinamide-phosphate guanylyltransferase n=1 Tax=Desulfatirhabdium butyrativorans TaxID=340467 RepID=UPI0006842667|nr:bifunctional adenosylcobinamide kinase/adenosylcobinamide-phosphate guanylyltransferase [Desulfatirhabdium butyrativorans]
MSIVLVIGGCRSGKSDHALHVAESMAQRDRVFIATCRPEDEEMRQRVARHQRERDASWQVVESPGNLGSAIRAAAVAGGVVLVDCLTLWVADLLWNGGPDVEKAFAELSDGLSALPCPVVFVSGEVGMGMVPEQPVARAYRDAVGWVNRRIAGMADQVIWMVAGIPVVIRGKEKPA